MNFLYKINSGYGGPGGRFTPARIPERLADGRHLDLGWKKYLDAVDEDDPVWIYFRGPQRYTDGVYAIGRVADIDAPSLTVRVVIDRHSADEPLTDENTTARVAEAVATWFQQVFVMPDPWEAAPTCSVATTAESCADHRCETCLSWRTLPLIEPEDVTAPARLAGTGIELACAYWAVPPRGIMTRYDVLAGIRYSTDLFKSFKAGNKKLAYPFALGMRDALRARELDRAIDALVPIPLSPEKLKRREIHRTRLLATELGALLDVPVVEALGLSRPISKRALQREGRLGEFEALYEEALVRNESLDDFERVALVDDVSTRGSTLRIAAEKLRSAHPDLGIAAVTAAQMILRDVVVDERRLRLN